METQPPRPVWSQWNVLIKSFCFPFSFVLFSKIKVKAKRKYSYWNAKDGERNFGTERSCPVNRVSDSVCGWRLSVLFFTLHTRVYVLFIYPSGVRLYVCFHEDEGSVGLVELLWPDWSCPKSSLLLSCPPGIATSYTASPGHFLQLPLLTCNFRGMQSCFFFSYLFFFCSCCRLQNCSIFAILARDHSFQYWLAPKHAPFQRIVITYLTHDELVRSSRLILMNFDES